MEDISGSSLDFLNPKDSKIISNWTENAQCEKFKLKQPSKQFSFDGVYNVDSITETIYNDVGFPLVESVSIKNKKPYLNCFMDKFY